MNRQEAAQTEVQHFVLGVDVSALTREREGGLMKVVSSLIGGGV